jgi:hypothetical protein
MKRLHHIDEVHIEPEFRASEMSSFCPRRFIILRHFQSSGVRLYRPGNEVLQAAFDQGRAIHDLVQQTYFKDIEGIYGDWICSKCGTLVTSKMDWWHRVCPICTANSYRYCEKGFSNKTLRLGGHVDGLLSMPNTSAMVGIEIKSISRNRVQKELPGDMPCPEHIIQCAAYSLLTGINDWRVLYFVKEWNDPPLIERMITITPLLHKLIVNRITTVLDYLNNPEPTLPVKHNICSPTKGRFASGCPVAQWCLEGEKKNCTFISGLPAKDKFPEKVRL